MNTTKHYPVLSPIRMNGKLHEVGQTIALDDTQLEELRSSGAIDPEPAPAKTGGAAAKAKP